MDWNHPLETASPPVTMLRGYLTPAGQETILTLHCQDPAMKTVTATTGTNTPLFHVEGGTLGTSWSWRRKAYHTPSQTRLFDFRHASVSLSNPWIVENAADEKIASIVHCEQQERKGEHSAVDATVRVATGEDVRVVMRHADGAGTAVAVRVGEACVAVVYKMEDNRGKGLAEGRAMSVWKARIAPETDLSLILMMMLCRAEMAHVWSQ